MCGPPCRSLQSARLVGLAPIASRPEVAWLALLGDASGFTDFSSDVIELGAANFTAADDFKFFNVRAVDGKGSFDTDTVADFADGDVAGDTAIFDCDYETFEYLDPFFTGFTNFDVGAEGIAGFDNRQIALKVGSGYALKDGLLRHRVFSEGK